MLTLLKSAYKFSVISTSSNQVSEFDCVSFMLQDFDVGKTYKKKVTLTNVSYTVNYCKYLDITERLKDFIHIQ